MTRNPNDQSRPPPDHQKELLKLFGSLAYRHSAWQVFADFAEAAAISISNAVDWPRRDQREERYLEIVRRYRPDEFTKFPKMLGELTLALEEEPFDVLGRTFHDLELHNTEYSPAHVQLRFGAMRAWNRTKLLWGYLRHKTALNALPVEYIVETTAKCNLYCPMCPRETHKQPKEDMADEIFTRLVRESGRSAEHMMLIGLGEPFMDRKIFDRIEYCAKHNISTLLSTNGTFFDEKTCARLLDTPLEHITLSFDGASKESYEYYRKGANFEKVRDNFVRFARMKKERGAKVQVVAQLVRMERNANEVDDFIRFWSAVPGVDQVRVKEDETNLLQPEAGHAAGDWKHPCHYLWRGPMYVKHNGDVYPCCQSYMLDGQPVGNAGEQALPDIWNSDEMQRMRKLHVAGRANEIDICSRCCTTIPHPLLVAGSLLLHGRTVRRLLPWVERLVYFSKLPRAMLTPPKKVTAPAELVQIERR